MKARVGVADSELARSQPSYRSRREPRACGNCGHVRIVTVHFIEQHGQERDHRWIRGCSACSAERRARHYAALARRFEEKGAELRARQAKAVQRWVAKTTKQLSLELEKKP